MKMTFGTKSDEMTVMDLILCEYQTKFYELVKLCNKVDYKSNPAFFAKEFKKYKEKWNVEDEF